MQTGGSGTSLCVLSPGRGVGTLERLFAFLAGSQVLWSVLWTIYSVSSSHNIRVGLFSQIRQLTQAVDCEKPRCFCCCSVWKFSWQHLRHNENTSVYTFPHSGTDKRTCFPKQILIISATARSQSADSPLGFLGQFIAWLSLKKDLCLQKHLMKSYFKDKCCLFFFLYHCHRWLWNIALWELLLVLAWSPGEDVERW